MPLIRRFLADIGLTGIVFVSVLSMSVSSAIERLQDIDLTVRFGLLIAVSVAMHFWMHRVVAIAAVGISRVVRALLLIPAVLFLTILFDVSRKEEFIPAVYVAGVYLWATLSKTWSFCMNRGQLVKCYESKNGIAFAVQLLFPVVVEIGKKRITDSDDPKALSKTGAYKDVQFEKLHISSSDKIRESAMVALRVVAKVGLLVVVGAGYAKCVESGMPFWRDVCVGWFMYGLTSMLQDLNSLPTLLFLNLKTAPNFDCPYMSQSVQEFWSHRYNMVIGTSLRDLVYNPICEGRSIPGALYSDRGSPTFLRQITALLATFVVSGVFHSLFMSYALSIDVPVLFGLFFVICGVIAAAETAIKACLKQTGNYEYAKSLIPAPLRIAYVHCVMYTLLHFIFLRELTRHGSIDQMINGTMTNLGLALYLFG